MPGPLTLIVFFAGGEHENDTVAQAMRRAAKEALGAETRIELHEGEPTDAEVVAQERSSQADAAVEVTWADAKQRHGLLRVHLRSSARWLERSVGFGPSDIDSERGRTLGFAAASMLPDADDTAASSTPPSPRVDAPSSARPPARAIGLKGRDPLVTLDVLGLASTGLGSSLDDFGAAAAVQWFVAGPVAMRLGGGVLGGTMSQAQATTLLGISTVGVTFAPLRGHDGRPGVAVHVDYLVAYEALTHFSTSSSTTTLDRWQSGLDAVLESDWPLSSQAGIVAGLGLEDVFSSTYVSVRGSQVATLPPLRVVAEIGVRAGI